MICMLGFSVLFFGQTYLEEDFSSGQMPPNGWSIDNVSIQWTASNSGNAGGTSPEAQFQWIQQIDTSRLISPQIDLTGLTSVFVRFNHMYDDYEGAGPSVGVATRSGSSNWNIVWEILPTINVGPETIELFISNDDVGQPDFQVCFYVKGDLFNLDYWYLDNISVFHPMELELKLLLEGPFENSQMLNNLNTLGYLPLDQPYDVPPWNYFGLESVLEIPSNNVTDWVLFELLKKDQLVQQKYISVAKQVGFILQDGMISGLDGVSFPTFSVTEADSLYVLIHHRNHLIVLSSNPLSQSNGIFSYDFTLDSSMVFHGSYAMKELSENKWGVLSGDGNADNEVNNLDKNEVWIQQQNSSGYLTGDYNMDGTVNTNDIEEMWKPNVGKGNWVPDTSPTAFVCGDTLEDTRDGHLYSTIQIGSQCWMQENLNYETGTNWCYYNNEAYCDVFGRLYNWNTIMNGASSSNSVPSGVQGICPEGWHLPSDAEWCIITQFIDPSVNCGATGYNGTDVGIKMKSTWGWSSGGNGTNESGFNALPAGCMGIYHFDDLYLFSYFWSTTEDYPGYAWLMKLNYGLPTIGRYFSLKSRGYSARCLRN
ncbi:MAG: FISUMP domain-containing protein [Bacteroidales bacterium]